MNAKKALVYERTIKQSLDDMPHPTAPGPGCHIQQPGAWLPHPTAPGPGCHIQQPPGLAATSSSPGPGCHIQQPQGLAATSNSPRAWLSIVCRYDKHDVLLDLLKALG